MEGKCYVFFTQMSTRPRDSPRPSVSVCCFRNRHSADVEGAEQHDPRDGRKRQTAVRSVGRPAAHPFPLVQKRGARPRGEGPRRRQKVSQRIICPRQPTPHFRRRRARHGLLQMRGVQRRRSSRIHRNRHRPNG